MTHRGNTRKPGDLEAVSVHFTPTGWGNFVNPFEEPAEVLDSLKPEILGDDFNAVPPCQPGPRIFQPLAHQPALGLAVKILSKASFEPLHWYGGQRG